jgi:uncharacterized protein (TIGR02246 family)
MVFRAMIAICALLTTTTLAAQSPADEAAVRAVVARYVNARELRDAAAIEPLFTRDADQLTSSGEWRRGRDAVVPGTLESSRRNPGTRQIRIDTVRFLASDVAIVDGPYEISVAGTAPRPMSTTIVVKREADAWRIAAIRNMVPTQ